MSGGRGKWADALGSRYPLGSQAPSFNRSLPKLGCLSAGVAAQVVTEAAGIWD